MESYFEGSDIDLDDVAPIVIPEGLPWLDPGPIFGFELAQYESETDPLLALQCVLMVQGMGMEWRRRLFSDGRSVTDLQYRD